MIEKVCDEERIVLTIEILFGNIKSSIGGYFMKKFRKSDRFLQRAYILSDILSIIIFIVLAIVGIMYIVGADGDDFMITVGVVFIVGAPILAFLVWVFTKVMLNMCCDIKLIRNKLYGEDDDYLLNITEDKNSVFEDIKTDEIGDSDIDRVMDPTDK